MSSDVLRNNFSFYLAFFKSSEQPPKSSPLVWVNDSEGLNVSTGTWVALKMKRYMSSLADLPQLTEKWLYNGYTRIFQALKEMHKLNKVHMDIKSDNVFVDEYFNWDLGDFGSTREVGSSVWSFTQPLNPYILPIDSTVIPAMDFVLLCVMIAAVLEKGEWKAIVVSICMLKSTLSLNVSTKFKMRISKAKWWACLKTT